MKEFVISDAQAETAVLVGLITQTQNERKTNEYLDELEFLAPYGRCRDGEAVHAESERPELRDVCGQGKVGRNPCIHRGGRRSGTRNRYGNFR